MALDATGPEPETWEDSPRVASSAAPVLAVDGFEGPLDWLLDRARAEQIDLRRISILQLVDAFAQALQAALAQQVRADLTRWGEWLAMAAQLALLRSRLLLPPDSPEAKAAQDEAVALRRQVLEREAIRRAASWLDGRVQLGRDVFARGQERGAHTGPARGADIVALFRACLVVLRVPEHAQAYAPPRPPLWRVQDAMVRIGRLLAERPEGGELGAFLPGIERDGPDYDLRCRATVASTLVAGLELCRAGQIRATQFAAHGPIRIQRVLAVSRR